MPLYILPELDILADVNAKNGLTLVPSDVVFSKPTVASEEIQQTKGTNTLIRLTGNGTTWDKSVVTDYHRLPLSDLKVLLGETIKVPKPATTHELINALNFFHGTVLRPSDIKPGPVTLDEDGVGTVTLEAETDSTGWIGSVTFNVVKSSFILPQEITNTALAGFKYPNGLNNDQQAPMLMYGWDFTPHSQALATIPKDYIMLSGRTATADSYEKILKDAVLAVTAITLVGATTNTNYNMTGAKVIYNGPVTPAMTANQDYKHVMYIQLQDGTGAEGLPTTKLSGSVASVGTWIFHYNDPVDPYEF